MIDGRQECSSSNDEFCLHCKLKIEALENSFNIPTELVTQLATKHAIEYWLLSLMILWLTGSCGLLLSQETIVDQVKNYGLKYGSSARDKDGENQTDLACIKVGINVMGGHGTKQEIKNP